MGILEHLAVEREKEGREKGLQEGLEKGEIKVQRVIENLLSNTEFSDEKIAELANVSIERVKTIREGLSRR
ncbi:MAG TPA: hypothetical protein VGN00_02570 [Puia sp.]